MTYHNLALARSAAPDHVCLFVSRTGQAIGVCAFGADAGLLENLRHVLPYRHECEARGAFHCCTAAGLQSLLSDLVAAGHRVAICEQTAGDN